MQFDETYKGYRIKYRQSSGLAALIWPPNFPSALSDIPQATMEEGMNVLRTRVYATIDLDIEKTEVARNKK